MHGYIRGMKKKKWNHINHSYAGIRTVQPRLDLIIILEKMISRSGVLPTVALSGNRTRASDRRANREKSSKHWRIFHNIEMSDPWLSNGLITQIVIDVRTRIMKELTVRGRIQSLVN